MTVSRPLASSLFALLVAPFLGACTGSIMDMSADPARPAEQPDGPMTTGGKGGGKSGGTGGGMGMGGMGGVPGPVPTGPIAASPSSSSRFYRLSHKQWENTVRDLLRLSAAPAMAPTFISEPARGTFDNDGAVLAVGPVLWTDYQRAAEILAEKAIAPTALAKILPPGLPETGDARARAFIEGFGLRAFRRPLTESEITSHLALFKEGPTLFGGTDPFADGVQVVLSAMLQSPHFLYRFERSTKAAAGRVALDDYEIASRLSYGLIGTMPDAELFAAAAAKKLTTREGVAAEATRLLGTKAAEAVVADFHAQLLHMTRYDFISKDEKKFPEYKGSLNGHMKTETQTFIKDVLLTRGKGLAELFTAPYTFANSRIAQVYGLATPAAPATGQPDPFVKVELDPAQRAGILTQPGFLASFADAREPNTILRGAFMNADLLCVEMPPPPDNVPALPTSGGKTNRQRVEAHTHNDSCGGCHKTLINPLGFAFENYDALGKYRTMDGTSPVNAADSYVLDGETKSFGNAVELAKLLAKSRQAHDCYAKNWLQYVFGRSVDHEDDAKDRALWTALGERSLRNDASVKSLIADLVATEAFTTRTP